VTFRLRVLALIVLVATVTTAASAWLTVRLASSEAERMTVVTAADRELITNAITRYGRAHGTWEGVADEVRRLSERTGERIHLQTQDLTTVVADSDAIAGRTPRPMGQFLASIEVGPPSLRLPADAATAAAITLAEIEVYRTGVRFAACMTRLAVPTRYTLDEYGVPRFEADDPRAHLAEACRAQSESLPAARDTDAVVVGRCLTAPSEHCFGEAFLLRTHEGDPAELRLSIGVARPDPTRVAGAVVPPVAAVALLVILGTVLLSRHVLRPIERLTAASQRLGEGDLSERVPAVGRDELADLARSFNRMADSIQRAEERQRRMITDVAHELRTPLANLRGYLEALKDGVIAPDPDLFRSLHDETLLQQRIVDDLQTLALAEAGALTYHWATVDVGELLETAGTAHSPVAAAGGVALDIDVTGQVSIRADPDRLRQVLGILLTNAVRHSPTGATVTLRAAEEQGTAVLRVIDHGSGISEADLPHVFDRFWRADSARQRTTGGSGLGLAIARQIVADHDGDLSVTSRPGEGSTFAIAVPAVTDAVSDRDCR